MNGKQLPKCLFLKGKFLIFSRETLGGKNRNMSTEILTEANYGALSKLKVNGCFV